MTEPVVVVEEVSGRPRVRAASPGGLLLLALTVLGLFAMHGLQATASPAETHPAGIAIVMPAMGHPDAGHHASTPSHDAPGHRHPGGGMCLALLVMAALVILAVVLIRRGRRATPAGHPAGRADGRPGRAPPPPSIFRLSVLRL